MLRKSYLRLNITTVFLRAIRVIRLIRDSDNFPVCHVQNLDAIAQRAVPGSIDKFIFIPLDWPNRESGECISGLIESVS